MRLDDVLNLLGSNRDYLILALAVLVLVEGGIIVLWARRAIRLRRELQGAVAAADAARAAAERAAAAATEQAATYRAAPPRRELYSVAARTAAEENPEPASQPAPAPAASSFTQQVAPTAAASSFAPHIDPAPRVPSSTPPLDPTPATVSSDPAPAEYVTPAAQQAAAWVLPEVAASNGNGNGHGHTPTTPAPTTWTPAPAPTTMGWSETPVPVEPAADFAVVSDPAPATSPEPATAPNLTVLDGTRTWSFPAAAPAAPAQVPTHFDPAMFDTNDDVVDDLTITGDILLVEDDPTIAKLYRVLLESRGYTVRHAIDGLDGLDRANEKRPDLVLLDIMMPRMNGIAFLQALRSGEMREVPVVVLSNFMEKQLVDDAMSLGALEYMVKAQTRPEALVGALPHWLRGERAFSY